MYTRLIFVSKIKPDSLLVSKLSITAFWFYKSDLFLGFCIRKKNQEISDFHKMGEQKSGVSGLISHCMREYFPKPCKAKIFVNFLHKLYQKYVKQDIFKHRHPFAPFFLELVQNVSKKVTFKIFGLFLLFVFRASFRTRFPFIKKADYNVKVHEILISK